MTKKQTFSFTLLPAILSLIVKIIRKRKISLWWHTSDKTNSSCVYSKTNFQTIAYDRSSTKLDSTQHNTIQYIYIYIFSSQFTTLENQSKERTSPSFSLSIPRTIPPKNPPSFNLSHHHSQSSTESNLPLSLSFLFSLHQCPHPLDALVARWKVLFQPGGGGLRLIRNYQRPLFPYRRRTDSRQPPPSPTRRKDLHQEVALESTPGGRLAARQETSCWREYRHRSFIVAGKRLKRASRLAWTRIIPRPICRRSIHCSADPWPRRSSVSRVDFDRGPTSLHLSFCGRFSGWWMDIAEPGLAFNEGEDSRRRELRHSLRVDSKSWF